MMFYCTSRSILFSNHMDKWRKAHGVSRVIKSNRIFSLEHWQLTSVPLVSAPPTRRARTLSLELIVTARNQQPHTYGEKSITQEGKIPICPLTAALDTPEGNAARNSASL